MNIKSMAEIEIMDRANRIIREILRDLRELIRPGVTTLDIDTFAEARIRAEAGVPAFKGYPHRGDGHDFPGTVCASVNDEVVHGIPSPETVLREGDIVSVDLGILYQGYYGDAAETYPVGNIVDGADRLLRVTRKALVLATEQARVGRRLYDIGHAVQSYVEGHGFSVVREFVGHGIGSHLHEDPQVPNFGKAGAGPRLVSGMVLALEPMVSAGAPEVVVSAADGWTARTRDGSLAAHFEWSVAVMDNGPKILGEPVSVAS